MNRAAYGDGRSDEQRSTFLKLLRSLKKFLRMIAGSKLYLSFELPKSCMYWKWGVVRKLVKEHNLVPYLVDGCAVGVVATQENVEVCIQLAKHGRFGRL